MKHLLLAFIIVLGCNAYADHHDTPKKIEKAKAHKITKMDRLATIDQQAPDFTLKAHDGKSYKLSELKGKLVVLEWFNHECPYVKKHYDSKTKNMQKTQSSLIKMAKDQGQELVWLTIISSAPGKQGHISAEKATQLKAEYGASMNAFLFDEDGKVGKLYAAKTTPHMYIINQDGVLKYAGGIDDKASANPSSLKGAKNYVSAAVKSLLSGQPIANSTTQPYGCSVKYL